MTVEFLVPNELPTYIYSVDITESWVEGVEEPEGENEGYKMLSSECVTPRK